jgi:hypothetical protein
MQASFKKLTSICCLYNHAVGSQYGGEVVNYEEGLAFVTFHGSGTLRMSRWVLH